MSEIIKIKNIRDTKRYSLKSFMDLGLVDHSTSWLAGGAVRSLVDKSKIQDYDVFFKDQKSLVLAKEKLLFLGAELIFECPLGELSTYIFGGMKIQLISKRFYSDLNDLLTSFDFSCCQFSFDGHNLYTTKEALKDTIRKELKIVNLEYPVATINRISKYKKKGYKVEKGILSIVRILLQAQDQDYTDENMVLYVD